MLTDQGVIALILLAEGGADTLHEGVQVLRKQRMPFVEINSIPLRWIWCWFHALCRNIYATISCIMTRAIYSLKKFAIRLLGIVNFFDPLRPPAPWNFDHFETSQSYRNEERCNHGLWNTSWGTQSGIVISHNSARDLIMPWQLVCFHGLLPNRWLVCGDWELQTVHHRNFTLSDGRIAVLKMG